MSWCCISSPRNAESEAVEINVRSTLDATEAWLEMCRAKRAHFERQRRTNVLRRSKLEQDRIVLLGDKEKAQEELQQLQADLDSIDAVFLKLDEAEREIERVDRDLQLEERDMRAKEESIKEHLALISTLTVSPAASEVAVENILTPPGRQLKSLSAKKTGADSLSRTSATCLVGSEKAAALWSAVPG